MFEIKPSLNKNNILSRVSEIDIFRHYCKNFKKPGENFCSDFRKDKNPSCRIDNYKGSIIYKDFSIKGSISCFGYVMTKYKVTYIESLSIINNDFNLNLDTTNIKKIKEIEPAIILYEQYNKIYTGNSEIRVKYCNWQEQHIQYIEDYKLNINRVSEYFKVNPISHFWLKKQQIVAKPLAFAYYFGLFNNQYKYKIYQPNQNKSKWFHNLNENIIQGINQIPEEGELLIMSKAYKDVLCYDNFNIPAIAPGAEGWEIPEKIINDLKQRFKTIIVIYDKDRAGVLAMNKLRKKYNLHYFYLNITNNIKDFADYCKYNSVEKIQEEINKLKEIYL